MSNLEILKQLSEPYLPADLKWVRKQGDYELTDPNYKYDFPQELFEHRYAPTPSRLRKQRMASRTLFTLNPDQIESYLPQYLFVMEAASNIARMKGAELANSVEKWGNPIYFTDAIDHFETIGSELTTIIFSSVNQFVFAQGLKNALRELESKAQRIFAGEATKSFLFHAYGKPRAFYTAAELQRWPIQDIDSRLVLEFEKGSDGDIEAALVAFFRNSPFHLSHRSGLIQIEIWSLFFDAAESWRNYLPQTLLPPEAQWKKIPNIELIIWFLVQSNYRRDEPRTMTPDINHIAYERLVEEFSSVFTVVLTSEQSESVSKRPEKYPYGVSPRGAELLCRDWMEFLGVSDAVVSQFTADGGIDILSQDLAAQVKHYKGSVGGPEVQQLVGAALIMKRKPLFFTSGKYTTSALKAAEEAQVPLLTYNAEDGTLLPANRFAEPIIEYGFNTCDSS